jgi:fluoride exporter
MQALILVALGGAAGAAARHLAAVQAVRWLGSGWPYGTLAVNVAGGLLMGVLAGALAVRGGGDQERWRLLLGVGVLGGFTTFSAFSLEVVLMLQRRTWGQAALYSLASVVLSVGALFLGLALARRLFA